MPRHRIYSVLSVCLLVVIPALAQVSTVIYQGKQVVSNQVVLRLRSSDSQTLARVASRIADATIVPVSPSLGIHVLRSKTNNVAALMAAFAAGADVVYAEPDYILHGTTTPNDSQYPQLWAMPKIGAPQAWGVVQGSNGSMAAVIDTGIDYTHPDLAANVWSAPTAFSVTIGGQTITCPAGSHGFNAINMTCDPMDDNSHGTHVSGTIGAVGNNTTGVAGVNWSTKIMGVKFLDSSGSGPISDALNGIEFIIQTKGVFASTATPANVRVISASWGGSGFSQSFLDELNKAYANNLLFVAAAGNSASNNDTTAFYPANYTAPNVIAVAATDSNDTLASFSDWGKATVHLGAPGVNILSTVVGGGYAYMSGTSMATPHVSGAALLTLGACPVLTTDQLKSTLLSTVDPVAGLQSVTISGGRLNVANAIQSCTQVAPPPPPPTNCTATVAAGDWQGQYFGNMTLSGTPLMVRDDGAGMLNIVFNGSPSTGCGLPGTQFSVRWTNTVSFATTGTYTFSTSSDDGMRLYIDGTKVLDRWWDQSASLIATNIAVTAGTHTIVVEYYQNGGDASAAVSWQLQSAPPPPNCTATVPASDWQGQYFGNMTLSGAPLMVRDDGAGALNQTFNGSPSSACGLPATQFSVRWTETANFATSGTYVFNTSSDDGMRIYIDGTKVLDRWWDQSPAPIATNIPVTAGTHAIVVEYYQDGGGASASVSWQLQSPAPTCSVTVPAGDWQGQYFGNMTLSGTPLMVRDDGAGALNQTFNGSPNSACGLPATQFSVRWTQTANFVTSGTYVFNTSSDDGMRIYIDGTKVLDRWWDQTAAPVATNVPITAGTHTVVVEYYQDGGYASAAVSWQAPAGNNCAATVAPGDWKGEYFNNMSLSGSPVMVRDDGSGPINLTFSGSPSTLCGVPATQFSVRWTQTVTFAASGTYTFNTSSDDGMRLYIDGTKVLDRWWDQSAAPVATNVPLTAGTHTVVVEYYQDGGYASAAVSWQLQPAPPPVTNCAATVPASDWKGEYFNNMTLTGTPSMVRDDGSGALNLNWGAGGSPSTACGLPGTQFSVRWTRIANFNTAMYTFTVSSDDGMRVYVDGVRVIDRWWDQSAAPVNINVPMTAGSHTIVVEYYQNWGNDSAALSWQ